MDLALQLVGILGTVRNDFNSIAFAFYSSVCLLVAGDSGILVPDADLLCPPLPANVLDKALLNWSMIPGLLGFSVFAFLRSIGASKL